jgi:predicted hydrocarbon binding protein
MNLIQQALLKVVGKRTRPMLHLLSGQMGAFAQAFHQKYGSEALPIIAGVVSQGGVEYGKMMQRTLKVRSMKAAAEQQKMMDSMMGLGLQILEQSDDKLHFTVSKCPFGIERTSKELCESMMVMDEKRMSTFLGQDVEVKILKSLAAGDQNCEVIFLNQ